MSTQVSVQPQPEQPGIDLQDYLEILYRRRYLALLVFLVTAATALYFTLRAPPQYRTSATLVVEASSLGLSTGIPGQISQIKTLAEILKSRVVAERALKRAGLNAADLGRIRGGVSVSPVEDTSLITITVTDTSPERATRLANAVAEEFISLSLDVRKRQAVAARKFLEDQVGIGGTEVRHAEQELLQFRLVGRNIALQQEIGLQVSRVADLQSQKTMLAVERQITELRIQEAQRQLRQRPELSASSFGRSPSVTALQQELTTLEIELALLREKYTDSHPQVAARVARGNELRRRLAEELSKPLQPTGYAKDPYYLSFESEIVKGQVDIVTSRARERALDTVIGRLNSDLERLPVRELTLARLTRNLQLAERSYLSLSERLQDARVIEASTVPDIRIVDTAQLPDTPVGPDVNRNILFGAMLGAVLGFGSAMGADYLDRSIRTPEQAERVTGLPVLGTIPDVGSARNRTSEYELRGGVIVAAHPDRMSMLAEAFRGVRTSLQYASPDRQLETFLVTSAIPGEGKTTVAVNLAISQAAMGRKVWLVEADLRVPSKLARMFPGTSAKGLTDYLVGAATLEEILNDAPAYGITYIPVGAIPPNPAELAGSDRMSAFLALAKETADFVICDSSPTMAVTDSVVIAPKVDGVIMVVEAARTPRELVQRMQVRLVGAGAHIVGLVLSKLPIGAGRYGGYGYGYGYGYGGYGGDGSSARSDAEVKTS